MVFLLSYITLGLVAWTKGDAKKVAYAADSRGEFCGQKNTPNEMKSFLFYFNILRCAHPIVLARLHCPTIEVCVSTCPDRFLTFIDVQQNYAVNRSQWEYYQQYCKPGFDNPLKPAPSVFRDEDCPSLIIPSRPFFKRCFPDFSIQNGMVTVRNLTTFVDGIGTLRNISDLQEAAKGISLLLKMRTMGLKIVEDFTSAWDWIIVGLFLAMIGSWLFLLFLRFCASFILWIFVVGVVGIIAYGIGYCYLEYQRLQSHPGAEVTILDLGIQSDLRIYLKLTQTWLLFMILLCIVEVLVLFLLLFLRKSFWIAVVLLKEGSRYHTGSIALGSITLTIVQCFRFFLEYLNRRLKDSERLPSKFIICCCKLCLWCLEKFLKFLNRNAYIMVAIYGYNFCTASRDAFQLVMRNVVRVAVLDKVTDFLLWMGKLLVSISIGVLGYLFLTKQLPIAAPTLNYYWLPLAMTVFGSYIISHGFFSVFAMCVDTLFLCFCEDLERNDGSLERPYFMSPSLLRALGKKQNKKLKKNFWKRIKRPKGHHSRVY
ncbi:choline transporter-like protein 5 [Gracilinanus agilis]|uniref:choline transporter-like protein 5 n=1 Tax=Gracilinanus agilis TaxID=191870 RepID=UPI001CFC6D2C|nr:choline transporter-like protein 5 [Gracilinanus agilis]